MTGPGRWRSDPDVVRPVVLVVGGFLTSPPFYRPFRRRLLQRGAADVLIAPIWMPDWLVAAGRGLGPLVSRAERGLRAAETASAVSPAAGGAPPLLVGHSAGGVVARLLLAPRSYRGRPYGAAERVGALVTLGSPLRPHASRWAPGAAARAAARFADDASPGAYHAPLVGYLNVSSRAVLGRPDGTGNERIAYRTYRQLAPEALTAAAGVATNAERAASTALWSSGATSSSIPGDGLPGDGMPGGVIPGDGIPGDGIPGDGIPGDGLVPVESALLPGARHIVLQAAAHGQGSGRPWYGAEPEIDRWWPAAVEAWHDALRARLTATVAEGQAGDGPSG